MAKVVINGRYKTYYNDQGQVSRDDGPAFISSSGHRRYFINEMQSYKDHPANIGADGRVSWYFGCRIHRDDGPAWDCPNGHKQWRDYEARICPKS